MSTDASILEQTPVGSEDQDPIRSVADLSLVGQLRLNLAALGIDPDAPDFGERLSRLSVDNQP